MSPRADITAQDPRHVLARARLREALVEDEDLRLRARSDAADTNQRALAKFKEIARTSEPIGTTVACATGCGPPKLARKLLRTMKNIYWSLLISLQLSPTPLELLTWCWSSLIYLKL